jgi:PAS domain S-box-containing protein
VRQLDRLYPRLKQEQPLAGPGSTITAPVEGLDLATVIEVSQAVSSGIVLEKLVNTVMRKAMEHAGAERGLLIIPRGDELQIEAESRISGNDVIVSLGDASAAAGALPGSIMPESILRYAMRTYESVILDDASSANPFSADPYFLQYRARSVFCLPLLHQAKLSGVLYLENNLAPRVFTSDRITVLRVLVSQAAISLENTRHYRDLEDREAKIRRLVDANILGIFIWNLGGAILGANEAFLRMLQYSRPDLISGGVRWTDLTPDEWREGDERALALLKATGTVQPYEKEYSRKDGSRVPVLIAAALFEEVGSEGVAFALDLSEQKRAEEALRTSERNLKLIVNTIPALAWSARADGFAEFFNQHYIDYVGLSAEQVRESGWTAAVHPDDLNDVIATWQRIIASGQPGEAEARLRRRDGEYRWFLFRMSPLRDEKGNILKWYEINTDIDDRRRAENLRLEERVNERTRIAGELHDTTASEFSRPVNEVLGLEIPDPGSACRGGGTA